jgi:uncharacterized protein YktB (UPF0637 family)
MYFQKLQTVKKAEILCGLQIERQAASKMQAGELLNKIDHVFKTLIPLYNLL